MRLLVPALLLGASTLFGQDSGPWTEARYQLITATVERSRVERGTAFLLDRETGRTWIYVEETDANTNLVNGWLELKRVRPSNFDDTTSAEPEQNRAKP